MVQAAPCTYTSKNEAKENNQHETKRKTPAKSNQHIILKEATQKKEYPHNSR